MAAKDSKAQLEVWEWKEAAYQQVKDIPFNQRIPFIIDQTKDIVAALREKRKEKSENKKGQ